jgi:hypothetical protein
LHFITDTFIPSCKTHLDFQKYTSKTTPKKN